MGTRIQYLVTVLDLLGGAWQDFEARPASLVAAPPAPPPPPPPTGLLMNVDFEPPVFQSDDASVSTSAHRLPACHYAFVHSSPTLEPACPHSSPTLAAACLHSSHCAAREWYYVQVSIAENAGGKLLLFTQAPGAAYPPSRYGLFAANPEPFYEACHAQLHFRSFVPPPEARGYDLTFVARAGCTPNLAPPSKATGTAAGGRAAGGGGAGGGGGASPYAAASSYDDAPGGKRPSSSASANGGLSFGKRPAHRPVAGDPNAVAEAARLGYLREAARREKSALAQQYEGRALEMLQGSDLRTASAGKVWGKVFGANVTQQYEGRALEMTFEGPATASAGKVFGANANPWREATSSYEQYMRGKAGGGKAGGGAPGTAGGGMARGMAVGGLPGAATPGTPAASEPFATAAPTVVVWDMAGDPPVAIKQGKVRLEAEWASYQIRVDVRAPLHHCTPAAATKMPRCQDA